MSARLGQHGGLRAAAHHTAQVKAQFQFAQSLGIVVDDGDVIALRHQAVGHALAHAARSKDDDFHAAMIRRRG